jgi:hypothetical protein
MDDKAPKKLSRLTIISGVLLLAFALYVLSSGPAAWMQDTDKITERQFSNAYAPLIWLSKKVPMFDRMMGAYVSLWKRRLPLPSQPLRPPPSKVSPVDSTSD